MNDLTLYKSANGDLSTRLGLRGPYLVVSAVTDITVAEIEQLVEDAETLVEAHKKAVRERDEARAEAKKWKALAEASGRDAVRVAGERDKSLTANRRYREALKRIAAEAAVSRSHIGNDETKEDGGRMTKVSESRRAHEMERDARLRTCQSCGHLCDAPGEVDKLRQERDFARADSSELTLRALAEAESERDEARAVLSDLLAWAEDSPQNRRATKGAPCHRPWPVWRAQKFTKALRSGDDA